MQGMWKTILLVLCLVGAVSLCAASAVSKAAKEAPTIARDRAALVAWNKATLVDPYLAVGVRDPALNDRVVTLLEQWAQSFSGETVDVPALIAEGQALIASGCRDPLVRYCTGKGLLDQRQVAEALPLLLKAEEQLADSDYPAVRKYWAARRVANALAAAGTRDERYANMVSQAIAAFREAVAAGEFAGSEHVVVDWLMQPWFADPEARQQVEAMARSLAVPETGWLGHVLAGLFALNDGRRIVVTKDSAELADQRAQLLTQARASFAAALAERPDDPVAAAAMITVVDASDGTIAEGREWFERAIAQRFDLVAAYVRFASLLHRRGAHDDMLALADDCLASARYDTLVPWRGVELLLQVANARKREDGFQVVAFWRTDDRYDAVQMALSGMLAAPEHAAIAPRIAAWQAALAAGCGDPERMKRALEQADLPVFDAILKQQFGKDGAALREPDEAAATP